MPISAQKGVGLDDLKAAILVQAELLDLKAEFASRAEGYVLESKVAPGFGCAFELSVQCCE